MFSCRTYCAPTTHTLTAAPPHPVRPCTRPHAHAHSASHAHALSASHAHALCANAHAHMHTNSASHAHMHSASVHTPTCTRTLHPCTCPHALCVRAGAPAAAPPRPLRRRRPRRPALHQPRCAAPPAPPTGTAARSGGRWRRASTRRAAARSARQRCARPCRWAGAAAHPGPPVQTPVMCT